MRETAYSTLRSGRRRRRGNANWREFKQISLLVAERESEMDRQRIARKFDRPSLFSRQLWNNLKSEGIGKQISQGDYHPQQINSTISSLRRFHEHTLATCSIGQLSSMVSRSALLKIQKFSRPP
jgi:hypothetical protein